LGLVGCSVRSVVWPDSLRGMEPLGVCLIRCVFCVFFFFCVCCLRLQVGVYSVFLLWAVLCGAVVFVLSEVVACCYSLFFQWGKLAVEC